MTVLPTDQTDPNQTTRNQQWLEVLFESLWQDHFSDVSRPNQVVVKWGRMSRTRLGTITARGGFRPLTNPEISEIRINPLLQHHEVPESVIRQTIAHEVAHYSHGFCSPHPRRFDHPHRGNVIEKELLRRNL